MLLNRSSCSPSRACGKTCVPKPELGNEKRNLALTTKNAVGVVNGIGPKRDIDP